MVEALFRLYFDVYIFLLLNIIVCRFKWNRLALVSQKAQVYFFSIVTVDGYTG